jgi:hypothetical protein
MPRPRQIDWKLVSKAQAVVFEATDVRQLKAAQAVLLPALVGTSLERTAALLGVGRASVHRLQQQFRQRLKPPSLASKGMGRAATGAAELGRRSRVPGSLGRAGSGRRGFGGLAAAGGVGRKARPKNRSLGDVPPLGPARVAESSSRYAAPEKRSGGPGGVEKKLPEALAALLTPEVVGGRRVRLTFQDEARFGRMVRPKRCWAPAPLRPVLGNGYEREFVYVYGAVSPLEGELDWRLGREMNTARMAEFLAQVSQAHPAELIVMVLDGASSHKAKDLAIPDNIRLLALPPYAPQLNPQEHVWDELREKEFPNRVFNHLDGVIRQLELGLPRMAADAESLRRLTAWPWIISLNLNAH